MSLSQKRTIRILLSALTGLMIGGAGLIILVLITERQEPGLQRKRSSAPELRKTPLSAQHEPTDRSLIQTRSSEKKPVICIDPGHPSEVGVGTQGQRVSEIEVAWNVALKLKDLLEAKGYRVFLTKNTENELVRNRERAAVANQVRAALMIRLHCDSDAGSGTAIYYPGRQGETGGICGPSLEVVKASRTAAQKFHTAMMDTLRGVLKDRGLHTDIDTLVGSKQGALTGSIFSKVPVLLVEMCVLTNPEDETVLADEDGQKRMANALSAGVQMAVPIK